MVMYGFQDVFILVFLAKYIHCGVGEGHITSKVPCIDQANCTSTNNSGTRLMVEQSTASGNHSSLTTITSIVSAFHDWWDDLPDTTISPAAWDSDYQVNDDWVILNSADVEFYLEQHETQEYIASFGDKLQRTLITETLRYCPYIQLCNFTFGLHPPPVSMNETWPCCYPCSCSSGCEYNVTCCPDYRALPLSQTISSVKATCMEAFIRHHSTNISTTFNDFIEVYQNCPPNTDESLRFRCAGNFELFSDISLDDVTPLSSNVTMKSYRNRYCALCNGVNPADLIQWEVMLKCESQPSFVSTSQLISGILAGSSTCVLKLVIPQYPVVVTQYCGLVVDSCNGTGLWLQYDHDVERACGLYETVIQVEPIGGTDTTSFKNPFCAICNGMESSTSLCRYGTGGGFGKVYAFSGLLLIDSSPQPESSTELACGPESMFDVVTNRCREVTCPFYSSFQHEKCESYIQSSSTIGYRMFYMILPSTNISLKDTYSIIHTLHSTLEDSINSYCAYAVCDRQSMIILQEDSMEDITDVFIDRIEIMYDVSTPYCSLMIDQIVENLLSMDNLNVQINDSLASSDGPTWFDVYLTDDTRDHDTRIPYDRYVNWSRHGTPLDLSDMIAESFKENGQLVVPYFLWSDGRKSCGFMTRLLTLRQCPMFSLNKMEIGLVETPYGLRFNRSSGILASPSDFVYDDEGIRMCVDIYTRLFKNTATHAVTDDVLYTVELIVSVVSVSVSVGCLVITLVTYSCLPELRLLPGKNNMALIVSLLLAQTAYLLGSYYSGLDPASFSCRLVGGLTHFFWLLSIFWMNVCTFHMFRVLVWTELVSDIANTIKYLQYHAYCIILSTLFVSVNIIVSMATSDYTDYGYGESSCYISSQRMIEVTFGLPAALVVIANILMFIIIVVKLTRASTIRKNVKNERNYFFVFVKLSTITGATWLFGFVYMWTGIVAFSFIFILLNGSQGLFIMLSFVCNVRTMSKLKEKSKTTTASVG